MKRLIVIFVLMGLAVASYGQQLNPKGLYVGKVLPINANSMIQRIDSVTVDNMANPTNYKVFHGADTLIPYIPVAGYDDVYDFVPKLVPDTVALSAGRTLVLTDANKRIKCTFSARDTIFIPANASVAFVKETTIYFSMEGAGAVFFSPLAGVTLQFPLDSVNLNTPKGMGAIIYNGNNNWRAAGLKE